MTSVTGIGIEATTPPVVSPPSCTPSAQATPDIPATNSQYVQEIWTNFISGNSQGIVRPPNWAPTPQVKLAEGEKKAIEAFENKLVQALAVDQFFMNGLIHGQNPAIRSQVQQGIDASVQKMSDEERALFKHISSGLVRRLMDFVAMHIVANPQIPHAQKKMLDAATADIYVFAIQGAILPRLKDDLKAVQDISKTHLANLVLLEKTPKVKPPSVDLPKPVEIPEDKAQAILKREIELVSSSLRDADFINTLKGFDEKSEVPKRNYSAEEEALFSQVCFNVFNKNVRPLLPRFGVQNASDKALEAAITKVLQKKPSGLNKDHLQLACDSIRAIHPGYLQNLIILKAYQAAGSKPTPPPTPQGCVDSYYDVTRLDPQLLDFILLADKEPEAHDITLAKRLLATFLEQGSAPEKAIFNHLVYTYYKRYLPAVKKRSEIDPKMQVSNDVVLQAIQFVVRKRILEITKELTVNYPKFVQTYEKYGQFLQEHEDLLEKIDLQTRPELEKLKADLDSNADIKAFLAKCPEEIRKRLIQSFQEVIKTKV